MKVIYVMLSKYISDGKLFYIIIEWKLIHYFACGLETPLNTIEQILENESSRKSSRLEFKSLRFQEGNIRPV